MSIRISNTSIHFGNFTLTANTEGFSFDGKIRAKRGFVDSSVPTVMGKSFGYSVGGFSPSGPGYIADNEKFTFTSDSNGTDVGDLSEAHGFSGSQSSFVAGYMSGGLGTPTSKQNIDKFPFAVDTNGTDVGDLSQARYGSAGQSSVISGYTSAGHIDPPNTQTNTIDKFPFASDGTATDVGDATVARRYVAGQTSSVSGYTSGGDATGNRIDKFPFAVDTNASDVGDLSAQNFFASGLSSKTNGYVSGGQQFPNPSPYVNVIEKFPFASDSNATDVGDLTQIRAGNAGQSSTINGYNSGGWNGSSYYNTIDKFPFATDTNAKDVGDLVIARRGHTGNQN